MKKSTNTLIWTITALVMIAFSNCFIHKENVGAIINIIASLIVTKEIMRVFNKGGKKIIFWGYVGVVARLASVLINMISLAF